MRVGRSTMQIGSLILLTLFITCTFFLAALFFRRPPSALSVGELHANWQQQVAASIGPLLSSQPSPGQITQAKNTLLYLRIAPQDRDADLALVMALLSLERNEAGAMDRLQAAFTRSQR